jgi:predicted transposase/invertase (TIGR01784 family)
MFDKWLFVLKNLSRLLDRPKALQERVFKKLFEQAEIAQYTPEERRGYEDSLKAYRDINNAIQSAKKESWSEGRAEGRAEGRSERDLEIARQMKADGLPTETIAKYTQLTPEEIATL